MKRSNIPQATPEREYAEIREILREIGEKNRELAERQAESDRLRIENERILTEKFAETDRLLTEKFAKTDRLLTEKFAETDRLFKESAQRHAEMDLQMKETDRQMKETDRQIKAVNATLGAWANNHGSFAEDYFYNSFKRGKRSFFGEKFDKMEKNVDTRKMLDYKVADEYDILLINGKSIGIIEVKFKAHKNDIPQVMKKVDTFRLNYPKFAGHQVYLGLASLSFSPAVEQTCIDHGIAIIKQVGDTVVINDKHLKVY